MPFAQSRQRGTALTPLLVVFGAIILGLSLAWWMSRNVLKANARTTVVWISVDGLRGDYVLQPGLPFFERLRREAAWTGQLVPVFPSITFPSHCSLATGVTVGAHGIPANTFYDAATRVVYSYPSEAALLQAEPIWLTAQRQGVPTAVLDWPLSNHQLGAVQTVVFGEKFDGSLPDDQRLEILLAAWQSQLAKPVPQPLGLVMGYVIATDKPGHKYGPDSEELRATMRQTDTLLASFCAKARALWLQQRRSPRDRLFFVFSADHGMSTVSHFVSFDRMLGVPRKDPIVRTTTTGNIGHIFLDPSSFPMGSEIRQKRLAELKELALGPEKNFRAFYREEMPPAWGYAHPTRCGDIIVILPKGYTFHMSAEGEPVAPLPPDATDSRGMHGYDPRENPEMLGFLAFWEASRPGARGFDLGEVTWDRVHPTVARLLDVQPAAGAKGLPLAIGGTAK